MGGWVGGWFTCLERPGDDSNEDTVLCPHTREEKLTGCVGGWVFFLAH